MDFLSAVQSGFKNYVNFSTRSSRTSFWYWILFSFIARAVTSTNQPLYDLTSLALLIPSLAVAVRRMHDIGRNGWWSIVPFYNIYLAAQPGDSGANSYGPPEPPKSLV